MNEIVKLKNQINLLMELVDPDRNPFAYHMLEADADKKQVDAVFDLMKRVRDSLNANNSINHGEFEREIYKIFPSKDGSYGFAEGIVRTLNQKHQYTDVFEYYSKNGMNLIP